MVSLDRCNGSCKTLDDISSGICVPNKTEDVNLSVFNIIARITNQKHFRNIYHANLNENLMVKNVTQIQNGITINVNMSVKIQKNVIFV